VVDTFTFSDLVGATVVHIEKIDNTEIMFITDAGKRYSLCHQQDCCEQVYIDDIIGDLDDLLGNPLLIAEERFEKDPDAAESATWSFFEFATINGSITVRFYGASNGYYSETANLVELEPVDVFLANN
jgi:hypothetical protein